MVTIIVGTNRWNSNSLLIAKKYSELLSIQQIENQIFDLAELPASFLSTDMYGHRSMETMDLIEKYIESVKNLVFILPEYNGGYPGVVKVFIDGVEPSYFHNKTAALVGVSSGLLGNTRGLDAFSDILNYLQIEVLSKKVKLSSIEKNITNETLSSEVYIDQLNKQIEKYIAVYGLTPKLVLNAN